MDNMMYHSSVWRRSLLALACCATSSVVFAAPLPSVEALGQALYFDQNLSAQRTQSCATCHAP
ncbi:MAG: cytochrome c peroxidase, partial [Pseudomonadales bacterium]